MSSFYALRSQKHKNTDGLTVFFALLGSMLIKAAHKMLVKSTPVVNFFNILRTNVVFSSCMYIEKRHSYEKFVRLMKLTPDLSLTYTLGSFDVRVKLHEISIFHSS